MFKLFFKLIICVFPSGSLKIPFIQSYKKLSAIANFANLLYFGITTIIPYFDEFKYTSVSEGYSS